MKSNANFRLKPEMQFEADSPYYILIIWIVAVSLSSLILLSFHNFKSAYSLVAGTLVALVYILYFKIKVQFAISRWVICLSMILAVGLLFRAKPYLWLMGGQDQGVYVNMSEAYEKYGSPFIIDNVRQRLTNASKAVYDSTQHYNEINSLSTASYPKVDIEDLVKRGVSNINVTYKLKFAMHLPAVYLKNIVNSEYVFGFYPMHPLWMAMFSKIAGSDNRVYSLVFFSLLSIVSFALLAKELSPECTRASLFIALFLGLNPLHAFFSKFPVTEMVALFFSSSGFYYFAKYLNQSVNDKRLDYIIISVLLFACMFFTRISGLIYIPIFYSAYIWLKVDGCNTDVRKQSVLKISILSIFIVYAMSVTYGMLFSYPYSVFFYETIFSKALGLNWLIIISVTGTIGVIVAVYAKHIYAIMKPYELIKMANLSRLLPLIFLILILLWSVEACKQIYNDTESRIFMTGFASMIAYISPVAFLVLIYSLILSVFKDVRIWPVSALMGIVVFYAAAVAMKLKVPYHYYYARYLLSEIVPFTLLFVSLALSKLWGQTGSAKLFSKMSLALICGYFAFFSFFQVKGVEADGAATSLSKITNKINATDLLLIGFDELRISTPVKYYYNKNIYCVNKPRSLTTEMISEFVGSYKEIFLLTKSPIAESAFTLIDVTNYKEGQYEHTNKIPMKFLPNVNERTFYLYKVPNLMAPSEMLIRIDKVFWSSSL